MGVVWHMEMFWKQLKNYKTELLLPLTSVSPCLISYPEQEVAIICGTSSFGDKSSRQRSRRKLQ